MKKIKTNMLVNMLIPLMGIVVFSYNYFKIDGIYYSDILYLSWIVIPIGMFIYNTLTETKIKKLVLLYTISAIAQVLGILIAGLLYYIFISDEILSLSLGLLPAPFTIVLNLVLSLIGITIRGLALKFKNCRSRK